MSKDGDERPLQSEAECDSFSEPVPSGDALCKNGDPTIADRKALEEFAMLPDDDRRSVLRQDCSIRGVLEELALTGSIRYPWPLISRIVSTLLDLVLEEFAAERSGEVGPGRPMPQGGSLDEARTEMHKLLSEFTRAPFTIQRLSEILLEPQKQYKRLDKLMLALDRLLHVTSTLDPADDANLPPLPKLSSLGPVNENPKSPYDGEPPAGPLQQQPIPSFANEGYDIYFGGGGDGSVNQAVDAGQNSQGEFSGLVSHQDERSSEGQAPSSIATLESQSMPHGVKDQDLNGLDKTQHSRREDEHRKVALAAGPSSSGSNTAVYDGDGDGDH